MGSLSTLRTQMPTSLMRSPQALFSLRPMSSQLIFTGKNCFSRTSDMKFIWFQRLTLDSK